MSCRSSRLKSPQQCFQCVVCGQRHFNTDPPELYQNHHCSPAALARYEARERRILEEQDPEHGRIPRELDERTRTFGQRLEDAYFLRMGILPL